MIWFVGMWGIRIQEESITSIDEWILSLVGNKEVTMEMKEIVAIKLWYIWKGRCEVTMRRKKLDVNGVYRRIIKAVEEQEMIRNMNKKGLDRDVDNGMVGKERWKKPQEGWIKLNCNKLRD